MRKHLPADAQNGVFGLQPGVGPTSFLFSGGVLSLALLMGVCNLKLGLTQDDSTCTPIPETARSLRGSAHGLTIWDHLHKTRELWRAGREDAQWSDLACVVQS